MKDDHHPLIEDRLEKQMGHEALRAYAKLGVNCNLVDIDCSSGRLGLILEFWRIKFPQKSS